MSAQLFDPLAAPDAAWPPGSEAARAYLGAFAHFGSRRLIANVRTRVLALRAGDDVLPVTVNDGERGNSYVCSPHNAYAEYAREELRLVPGAFARAALRQVTGGVSAALRAARADRIVHVNNWLLSTNLYRSGALLDPAAVARAVTAEFGDHFVCLRSLNGWSNAALIERLRAAGFGLLASRQIYVFDRLDETCATRSNARYDRRLLATTPYALVEHDALGEDDYARMAELYALLYVEKYSRHNPVFTADYVRVCHRARIMRFFGLRAPNGRLDGVLGLFALDGVVSAPVVGYDTAVDRRAGLYRLLMALVLEWSREHGHVVNLSSGAAEFKRLRGGRAVIEYSAVYDRHLAPERRAALAALRALLDRVAVPAMRRLAV